MNGDDCPSTPVTWLQKSIDRIYGMLDRLPDPPRLTNKPKWVRNCVLVIAFVLYLIVAIIPFAIIVALEFFLLFAYMGEVADHCRAERSSRPPMPSYLIQKAEIGRKVARGGRKGGSASAESRSRNVNERNEKILADAKELLFDGRAHHELVGILVKRYEGIPGYPKTDTQYRNILKPLRDKKNEN